MGQPSMLRPSVQLSALVQSGHSRSGRGGRPASRAVSRRLKHLMNALGHSYNWAHEMNENCGSQSLLCFNLLLTLISQKDQAVFNGYRCFWEAKDQVILSSPSGIGSRRNLNSPNYQLVNQQIPVWGKI